MMETNQALPELDSFEYHGSGGLKVTAAGDPATFVLVTCAGVVDVFSAPTLQEAFTKLFQEIPSGGLVVVDLEKIRYIDSTGLGKLNGALKQLKARRERLRLVITNPQLLKIFRITGLYRTFDIRRSIEDATTDAQPTP